MTRPSIRARKTCRPRWSSSGCAAGRSERCRSRRDRPCRSSSWTTPRCGRCQGSAGRPCSSSRQQQRNPVELVIECRFTNGGNLSAATRAMVQQTAPSVRQGLVIHGPRVRRFRRPCVVSGDGTVKRTPPAPPSLKKVNGRSTQGEDNMRIINKVLCASMLAASLAGFISTQAAAQGAGIQFRVVAGDRNPSAWPGNSTPPCRARAHLSRPPAMPPP